MTTRPFTPDELIVYDLLRSILRIGDYPATFDGICARASDTNVPLGALDLIVPLSVLVNEGIIVCSDERPRIYAIAEAAR